ncbi:MAG TPA: hypothetical protein VNL70_11185, partial [Tepidisphaeraceae bacterium]|nr:hypothetical protein [Tepidisphaeraceae bacterium]
WFDVSGDGRADFAISFSDGRLDQLLYDDDQDGLPDRAYRPADYANQQVPHVILLLDSIPYQTVADRYQAGDLRWFDAPQKLIAPFPTLTEICFSDVFHAPPLPGIIDRHYDPRTGEIENGLWKRVRGRRQPWERRLHYGAAYLEHGLSFLDPRGWYAAELRRAYDAIDRSPDRVTFVYFASAASMVCKFGRKGAQEVLDGAQRLCLQLLYDRRGAIKISMMSDHGHNYTPSRNIRLEKLLKDAGFRPGRRIDHDDDVVLDINGLVSCAGVHTRRPQRVAEALLGEQAIELAIYMEHDCAIVRSAALSAAIECRSGRLRYRPIDADVLELMPLIRRLQQQGLADADGFASDEVWFRHTLDHTWPNAPRRIWDALHRLVVNPPTVLLSLRDGYCAGIAAYERYISMQSTHGGLNQANSAAFVMSMTGRVHHPLPHQNVLPRLEPGYTPRVLR